MFMVNPELEKWWNSSSIRNLEYIMEKVKPTVNQAYQMLQQEKNVGLETVIQCFSWQPFTEREEMIHQILGAVYSVDNSYDLTCIGGLTILKTPLLVINYFVSNSTNFIKYIKLTFMKICNRNSTTLGEQRYLWSIWKCRWSGTIHSSEWQENLWVLSQWQANYHYRFYSWFHSTAH